MTTDAEVIDVVVVGAGAAGVGVGAALARLDVDAVLLDREGIGASFERWPAEMRFITPSFPSNGFGIPDLNAIAPRTSPAVGLDRQQLSGREYAEYLRAVADAHELSVETGVEVTAIRRATEATADRSDGVAVDGGTTTDGGEAANPETDAGFVLETDGEPVYGRFVVWAGGQFGSPRTDVFPGSERCRHNGTVDSWATLAAESEAEEFLVVGGFESGIDAAVNLIEQGRTVTVLDRGHPWATRHPDPSETLAPYTLERLDAVRDSPRLTLVGGADVERVEPTERGYEVVASPVDDDPIAEEFGVAGGVPDDGRFTVPTRPILATGFESTLGPAEELFPREGGHPALTDRDESPTTPGLFLAGPQVAHDGQLFCFVYKFRSRFPVIAAEIGDQLGVDTGPLEVYREANMFLEDLSCCEPIDCDC